VSFLESANVRLQRSNIWRLLMRRHTSKGWGRDCRALRPHRVGKARIPSWCVLCLSAFDTLTKVVVYRFFLSNWETESRYRTFTSPLFPTHLAPALQIPWRTPNLHRCVILNNEVLFHLMHGCSRDFSCLAVAM
jgi:hypothetical protein